MGCGDRSLPFQRAAREQTTPSAGSKQSSIQSERIFRAGDDHDHRTPSVAGRCDSGRLENNWPERAVSSKTQTFHSRQSADRQKNRTIVGGGSTACQQTIANLPAVVARVASVTSIVSQCDQWIHL